MPEIIGIDFDNTILRYDEVIYQVARELQLIPEETPREKTLIRDLIRNGPEGDKGWQVVQGQIYGKRILGAQMSPGLKGFVLDRRARGDKLKIVSRKTQFGHFDESKTDLQLAALGWMKANKFFERSGLQFSEDEVFFAKTRAEKLKIIGELRCTLFIDDLIEVLTEPEFPQGCKKILYGEKLELHDEIRGFETWDEIVEVLA